MSGAGGTWDRWDMNSQSETGLLAIPTVFSEAGATRIPAGCCRIVGTGRRRGSAPESSPSCQGRHFAGVPSGGVPTSPQWEPIRDGGSHRVADRARELAEQLLAGSDGRWRHTEAVAGSAARVAAAVAEVDRPLLIAAAWLHDLGYAVPEQRFAFHPLDGAWYLQERDWPPGIVGLVAHHSGARFVAAVRGLSAPMRSFDSARYARGPLADALTYADQTTGPDGQAMTVEGRLADMLRRHGPESPNARAHARRAPAIRAAVRRTEQRLGYTTCGTL